MSDNKETRPPCFADLEKVFPMGEDGLRHSPPFCLKCASKTECLRAAISGEGGVKVKTEKVDRAYASGTMGFFERWSKKKLLSQKQKK